MITARRCVSVAQLSYPTRRTVVSILDSGKLYVMSTIKSGSGEAKVIAISPIGALINMKEMEDVNECKKKKIYYCNHSNNK